MVTVVILVLLATPHLWLSPIGLKVLGVHGFGQNCHLYTSPLTANPSSQSVAQSAQISLTLDTKSHIQNRHSHHGTPPPHSNTHFKQTEHRVSMNVNDNDNDSPYTIASNSLASSKKIQESRHDSTKQQKQTVELQPKPELGSKTEYINIEVEKDSSEIRRRTSKLLKLQNEADSDFKMKAKGQYRRLKWVPLSMSDDKNSNNKDSKFD
jgi:hypothetical protein